MNGKSEINSKLPPGTEVVSNATPALNPIISDMVSNIESSRMLLVRLQRIVERLFGEDSNSKNDIKANEPPPANGLIANLKAKNRDQASVTEDCLIRISQIEEAI